MYRLSVKQRAFIRAYVPGFNATEAARVAGYSWPNKAGPRVSHSPKIVPLVSWWFYCTYGEYWSQDRRIEGRPDVSTVSPDDLKLVGKSR